MANVQGALLDDLAEWAGDMREARASDGELLESLDWKLRTLAGNRPHYPDPMPIDPPFPLDEEPYARLRCALAGS